MVIIEDACILTAFHSLVFQCEVRCKILDFSATTSTNRCLRVWRGPARKFESSTSGQHLRVVGKPINHLAFDVLSYCRRTEHDRPPVRADWAETHRLFCLSDVVFP
jgi:hypothetical protein